MSLPLHVRALNDGLSPGLYKVLTIEEALRQLFPLDRVLVDQRQGAEVDLTALRSLGVAGILSERRTAFSVLPQLYSLSLSNAVAPGDAIRVQPNGQVNVLFRRGANANTLFVTERCNSRCLMCSQPPRNVDDRWRIPELIELLPLVDRDIDVLGVTGGEPTLLGDELARLLTETNRQLPNAHVHLLTNGRTFSDSSFCDLFDAFCGRVTWAIPLYAEVARVHDFVVQADGAFVETMHGLHNLGEGRHRIEIRTVLHARTLHRMTDLARFISFNLPFVDHVALMGLEPMGLARVNMQLLATRMADISDQIAPAVSHLHQAGLNVSIYNLPLCALKPALRPFARKSISDWKNEYARACTSCSLQQDCCGFFRSSSTQWRDDIARPILEAVA